MINFDQSAGCSDGTLLRRDEQEILVDKAKTTNRGAVGGVSTARVTTILLLPIITICWILLVDPRLFGH